MPNYCYNFIEVSGPAMDLDDCRDMPTYVCNKCGSEQTESSDCDCFNCWNCGGEDFTKKDKEE